MLFTDFRTFLLCVSDGGRHSSTLECLSDFSFINDIFLITIVIVHLSLNYELSLKHQTSDAMPQLLYQI